MEHNYDLLKPKAGAKDKRGKIKRKSMRRLMAMLLSAVLAAGTCLPAMAVETTQTEEAGGAASTHIEQAAEVQPEESSNEAVTEESSEGTSTEVTVNDEETDGQAADPADDNSESAVVTDGGDTNDISADSDEIAGEAVTSDAAEIAAEEEPKGAVDSSGNLQNSQGNSTWLNDYSYRVTELGDGTAVVCLENYYGADTAIEVPGAAEIDGITYPVTVDDDDVWGSSVESFTFGKGFIFPENPAYFFEGRSSLTSVDMSMADTSRVTALYGTFQDCYNLREVNLGDIDVSDVDSTAYMFNNCSSIEELDLSCFSENYSVSYIEDMFCGCSNLRRLNLGGWDWSHVDYHWDVFVGCDSLEELVTPGYVPEDIDLGLPHMMMDPNGNVYNYLPTQTGSTTLTSIDFPEWLDDYSYYVSSEERVISVHDYNGSSSVITVPASFMLGSAEYQVKAQNYTWGTGVTSITFEGSDPFDSADSGFFESMSDLEVLDLRNVNCTYLNYMQFDDCGRLKTIYLPENCPWGSDLPKMFKDANNNYYFSLPRDYSGSIRLDAVTCDEWLEDFSYRIGENNAVILTGYYGNKTDLVIPGSAVIDGVQYNEIRIENNILDRYGFGSIVQNLKLEKGVVLGGATPSGNELSCLFANQENLESFDGSELGGLQFSYASYLFGECDNLRTVDLSGFDFSDCYYAEDIFQGCDSLETVETPVNVHVSVKLPYPFADKDGKIYTELPQNLSESITLTKTNFSPWLLDYDYEITDNSIVLLRYNKEFEEDYDESTDTYTVNASVTVPGSAEIGTTTYNKIVLSQDIWQYTNVKELYFGEGVFLPEDCNDLFSYESLEKIDLSKVNVTDAADMQVMFEKCRNLTTIVVPKGVSLEACLPGVFADGNGNNYTSLPLNVNESFTITKAPQDEWLNDFYYHISGNKIVLTGYNGGEMDLEIPGSAVVGNTRYSTVEIASGMDWGYCVEHLSFAKGVVVPENCSHLFSSYTLTSIDLSNIDTSHVTNMSYMFNCESLEGLDVSGLDTSNVTDMSCMFRHCSRLKELEVSGFNTSKVTNMSGMFSFCDELEELDVSKFDTSNVTDMSHMFGECGNLTELDVDNFNTANVTNMTAMFSDCYNLTSLDVSGFNTSKVTDMSYMFDYCNNLPVIDVSGFDTENVEGITSMFRACNALIELDLSGWDLSSVVAARRVFSGTIPVIKSPVNVPTDVALNANYTGSDGIIYDYLPVNKDTSILLTWASASGDPGGNESGNPSESGNPGESGDPSGTCEHAYGEWVEITPASCTEDGSRERVCTICGNKETETINAIGHQWNEAYTTDKEATCTEDGSESHHCTVCGISDTTTAVVIPAKGHKMTKTDGNEATCTKAGNKEYWTCSRCNKLFSDASGTEETTLEATVIPAKGHVWAEEYTVDKKATCAEEGSESIHCTVCGEMKEDSSHAIPKTEDHKYDEWVVTKKATCAEEGSESLKCTVCGKIKEGSSRPIPKTEDHKYGNWTVTKPATPTETGIEERVCEICGNKEEKELAVLKGTWKKTSKGWWYSWSDGSYPKSKFEDINGHTYYFDASGYMVTGWQKIDGAWYYFSAGGAMVTDWQKIGTTWYYFSESGVMQTGLQEIGGKKYYFSAGGGMQTGWQKIDGAWYYFSAGGAMVTDWQKIGTTWYYFSESGVMQTGWKLISGRWYYFEASGAMAANKWVGNYYLTGSGAMATNTWIGQYYVGADGKWIPGYKAAN